VNALMDDAGQTRLRALYDTHAPALFRYAMRLTNGDRGRAEDIVQETMIRAWRHAKDDDGRSIRPWLFTVAHRIAIDAHRARVARPPESTDTMLAAVPSADDLDATLDRIVVLDALESLSGVHRDVIVQTYYLGRSVNEAADALGVPGGTVKSRSYYALRAMKLALAERGLDT